MDDYNTTTVPEVIGPDENVQFFPANRQLVNRLKRCITTHDDATA